VHFLDVPRAELSARLAARNADPPPGTFRVREEEQRALRSVRARPARKIKGSRWLPQVRVELKGRDAAMSV
jgi:hypothetical protein